MHIVSINVGRPRPFAHNGELVQTGIFKQPITGRVRMTKLGLAGDGQADLVHHGGEYKAVYAYQHEMYDFWKEQLARDDFILGQFGENLTVANMPDDEVCIGDVYAIGTARVQVSQPRAPCFKLGIRMGDATFVKRFLQSCRVGFYLRVLAEGEIAAGEAFALVDRPTEMFTVLQTCRLMYFDKQNRDEIRRLVAVGGFSPAWREPLEKRLRSS